VSPLLLGAHLSISGGIPLAPRRASELGCNVLQIFTRNPSRWSAKSIPPEQARAFREAVLEAGIRCTLAHAPYLVNLASPDPKIRGMSQRMILEDLERCESLGISFLIVHPGSHKGSGSDEGIHRAAESLARVLEKASPVAVSLLLENTAGQGHQIAWKVRELVQILRSAALAPPRVGLCLDTCHAFAAGYDLRSPKVYARWIEEALEPWGLGGIQALHLNDSKGRLASRIDRHEHIGEGWLGLDPFRYLLADPRLKDIPKIIETPKERQGLPWDAVNLQRLRGLAEF